MDWGKKKSDKLAFEDVLSYIKDHHVIKPGLRDKDGKPWPAVIKDKGKDKKALRRILLRSCESAFARRILESEAA